MTTQLHAHQIKGSSQIHHCCHSIFRGIIVGDEMGIGKTLQAVMALHHAASEPGCFSPVVCPKSCQIQWINEFKINFEPVGVAV